MMDEQRASRRSSKPTRRKRSASFYEAIYARVRRFFMLRGLDSMTAEDLAQNVALKVYQRAGEVKDRALFYGWLFAVARNELHDLRRRHRLLAEMVEFEPLSGELSELLSAPPEVLNDALLQEWLAHLEPAERDLIVLRFVEELSYEELAVALGVPLGTVKSRLFHAKRRLSEIIESAHRTRFK
jgi:RNA polymerase sigma-70 factor, ECF subfamily